MHRHIRPRTTVQARAVKKERPARRDYLLWAGASLLAWGLAQSVWAAPSAPAVGEIPAAPAAATPSTTTPATPNAVPSSTYKLGPEDVLTVRVARHPQMDAEALVLEDGTISLPRVGRVEVAGKTLAEVQAYVLTAFKKVLKNPDVSVSLKTPRVERVFVFGAVNLPGPVEYKEGSRITEVLTRAGGLKFRPDWVTMTLNKKEGASIALSTASILNDASSKDNVVVAPGDVLIIQEIPPQPIFVGGAVGKAGMFDLREVDPRPGKIGVLEALALAGGPAPNAALSQAVIYRADKQSATTTNAVTTPTAATGRKQERVNLAPYHNTSAITQASTAPKAPDFVLYPGDTLHVPESNASVVVMGHVKTGGTFPLPEDRPVTLAEAIGMAGGPIERAKLSEVGIFRAPATATGEPTVLRVDFGAMLSKKQDVRQNPVLQPGDVVFVPETNKPDWKNKIFPAVSTVLQGLWYTGLGR